MSRRARWLNWCLARFERPALARIGDPAASRARFEWQARQVFRPVRRTVLTPRRLGTVPALEVAARGAAADRGAILYFHGGGYCLGSPRTHAGMLSRLSARTGLPAILPDYRLAPENPFPAAIDDALAAYRALLDRGVAPDSIALGGDSAGGGLVLSLLGQICSLGLPQPAMTFALSPWTDLALTGASLKENASCEVLLPPERASDMRDNYLGQADPKDPRASPLYADFTGAGPVGIWVGSTEVLRDDSLRLAARLDAQGVACTLTVADDLPHVWPIFPKLLLPEAGRTLDEIAAQITAGLAGQTSVASANR